MSKLGTVHKPFASSVDDSAHLFVVPLGNLVRDEERLVVTEEFRDAVAGHRPEGQHDKLLDRILHLIVFEDDWSDRLVSTAISVEELEGGVLTIIEVRI